MNPQKMQNSLFHANELKLLDSFESEGIFGARFHLDNIEHEDKAIKVTKFIQTFKAREGIIFRILIWQRSEDVCEFLSEFCQIHSVNLLRDYSGKKAPGIIEFQRSEMSFEQLRNLVSGHFNFEMALSPALNMRIQIKIASDTSVVFFDIYDDRGLNFFVI